MNSEKILSCLQAANLINDRELVQKTLDDFDQDTPWYIRTLVGLGAWFSSLFFIGFIAAVSFRSEIGMVLLGVTLLAVGIGLRAKQKGDFWVQLTLAMGLSGQSMLLYGVSESLNISGFENVLILNLMLCCGLFWVFPDRIMRVLQLLFAGASLIVLIYTWEAKLLLPLIGPAAALGMVMLEETRSHWISKGQYERFAPLQIGLMLAACGYLSLSTVYLLPELSRDIELYPNPWMSTILLGGILLFGSRKLWRAVLPTTAQWLGFGLCALVIGVSWYNPGLLLAFIILLMGVQRGREGILGFGLTYLIAFLGMYFYGIEVTFLTKSITLIGAGIALLSVRWLVLSINRAQVAIAGDACDSV